ncbi:MAG: sugar porter family MFS transporter [Opitutaceae bacterium]|nr:sugar porter family MFS transporter [Opitutaceae bacterium]
MSSRIPANPPPARSSSPGRIRYVLFVTGVAAIGGFLFGYDTAVINGANTYLKAAFQLTSAQEGLAGASAILGCIPGAMFAGSLSDRYGRRRLLFVCAVLYALSAVFSAIPRTFVEFVVARFVGGVGIGASSILCPVYIAEIAPEKWRGRLGTLFQLGIVTGIFLTLFVNQLVQGFGGEAWNTAVGWRWMLGLEFVPAAIFLGMLFAVPESPRWLVQQGRDAEARKVLLRVAGEGHADQEMSAIRRALGGEQGRWGEFLAGPFRRPLLIAVVIMACSQFCGINAIMFYSTKIFAAAGGGQDVAFSSSVWVGLINLLFTFVAIAFVDRLGRKPLLLIGTLVQVVALALVGWAFHTQQQGPVLLFCVVIFIAAFAMALGPIGWLLCSEIFPNKFRGRAMSVAAFTVWVCCFIVAQTFPMLNDNPVIGPAITFWIYALVSLFAFGFVAWCIPETKGRTLEEIEARWIEHPR